MPSGAAAVKERRKRGDDGADEGDGVRMYEKQDGDLVRGADEGDDVLFGSGKVKDRRDKKVTVQALCVGCVCAFLLC